MYLYIDHHIYFFLLRKEPVKAKVPRAHESHNVALP